jgi:hypothetical protein
VKRGIDLEHDPVEEGRVEKHGERVSGLLGLGLVQRRRQPLLSAGSFTCSNIIHDRRGERCNKRERERVV